MASDASVYNLLGQGVTPLLNPFDVQAKKIAMQNALANNALLQQEQQKNALAIQQQQLALSDQQNFDRIYSNWRLNGSGATPGAAAIPPAVAAAPVPGTPSDPVIASQALPAAPPFLTGAPAGTLAGSGDQLAASLASAPVAPASGQSGQTIAATPSALSQSPAPSAVAVPPRPQVPTVDDLINRGMRPTAAYAMLPQFQKIAQTASEIDEKNAQAAKARSEADKAQKESNQLVDEQAAQMADHILKGPRNADGSINPDLLAWNLQMFASHGPDYKFKADQVGNMLSRMNPAQQEQYLTTFTRTPGFLPVTSSADKDTQELLDKKVAELRSNLGGIDPKAPDAQNRWTAVIANVDPNVVKAANVPPAFSPANQAAVVKAGQSANEQVTAALTAKRDAATAANEAATRGIEQGRLNIEQKRFNAELGPGAVQTWVDSMKADPDTWKNVPAPLKTSVATAWQQQTNLPVPREIPNELKDREINAQNTQLQIAHVKNLISDPMLKNAIGPILGRIGNLEQSTGAAFFKGGPQAQKEQELRTALQYLFFGEGKAIFGGRPPEQLMDKLEKASANTTMSRDLLLGSLNGANNAAQSILDTTKSYRFGQAATASPGPAPAATSAYAMTATGPGNHKIGSNDGGATWFDVQTGKKVQ